MVTKENLLQFRRFAIGGGLGVLTYWVTFLSFTEIAGIWYIASAITGGVLNFWVNFKLHKLWTFKNKSTEKVRRQMILYAFVFGAYIVANTALLYGLVEGRHLGKVGAQLVATVLLAVPSFFATRQVFAE